MKINISNNFPSQQINSKKFNFFLKDHFGSRKASFIHSIIFNIQKGHGLVSQGHRWIYNTSEAWAEKLHCSSRTIERDIKSLREDNIIIIKHLYPIRTVRTNCYGINEDRLLQLFQEWQNHQKSKTAENKAFPALNVGIKAISYLSNKSYPLQGALKKIFKKKERPTYLCDHLLREFNAGFLRPCGLSPQIMTKSIAKALNAAVKVLGLSREIWSDLIDALRRNEWFKNFAKQKGWKLDLKNILRFKVLKRLLAGGFGIGFIEKKFGLPEDLKQRKLEATDKSSIQVERKEENPSRFRSMPQTLEEQPSIPSQYAVSSFGSLISNLISNCLPNGEDMSKIIPKTFDQESQKAKDLRQQLRKHMTDTPSLTEEAYLSWFSDHLLKEKPYNGFSLLVQGRFAADTIRSRYELLLKKFNIEVVCMK